jgi:hypothetical protein
MPHFIHKNFFKPNVSEDVDDFDQFIGLFNGLHEIGGETLRWKDMASSLPNDPKEAFKMEVACIVLLSKPAKVLFSGLGQKERKVIQEQVNDVDEELARAEANMRELESKVAEGVKIQQGVLDFAAANLKQAEANKAIAGFTGEEKFDKEKYINDKKKNTVHVGLANYLPMLTTAERNNLGEEATAEMVEARKLWRDEFKYVNLSKAKRIALLSLHFRPTNASKQHERWIKLHGGKPLVAKPINKDNRETKEIFISDIQDFRDNKKDWDTSEIKAKFSRRW